MSHYVRRVLFFISVEANYYTRQLAHSHKLDSRPHSARSAQRALGASSAAALYHANTRRVLFVKRVS